MSREERVLPRDEKKKKKTLMAYLGTIDFFIYLFVRFLSPELPDLLSIAALLPQWEGML